VVPLTYQIPVVIWGVSVASDDLAAFALATAVIDAILRLVDPVDLPEVPFVEEIAEAFEVS